MDLTALIDQAKKLGESLQANIQTCKDKAADLAKQVAALDGRKTTLDAQDKALKEREAKVSGIENAQNILAKAEQRNKDAEDKKNELFDREKRLAEDEAKLGDEQAKLIRVSKDLETKNGQLTRDWTIFNKRKKEFEQKNK